MVTQFQELICYGNKPQQDSLTHGFDFGSFSPWRTRWTADLCTIESSQGPQLPWHCTVWPYNPGRESGDSNEECSEEGHRGQQPRPRAHSPSPHPRNILSGVPQPPRPAHKGPLPSVSGGPGVPFQGFTVPLRLVPLLTHWLSSPDLCLIRGDVNIVPALQLLLSAPWSLFSSGCTTLSSRGDMHAEWSRPLDTQTPRQSLTNPTGAQVYTRVRPAHQTSSPPKDTERGNPGDSARPSTWRSPGEETHSKMGRLVGLPT